MGNHLVEAEDDELPQCGQRVHGLGALHGAQVEAVLEEAILAQASQRLREDIVVTATKERLEVPVTLRSANKCLDDVAIQRWLLRKQARGEAILDVPLGKTPRLRNWTPMTHHHTPIGVWNHEAAEAARRPAAGRK